MFYPMTMLDPQKSAQEAGLKYVTDQAPGIRRKRKGKGFTYIDDSHGKVDCEKTMERIQNLVIPPAWEDVWICRFQNGHLQVTGRDARERKQYRYHEKWTIERNETKFHKLSEFGKALPKLRDCLNHDLKLSGLPKPKVLAAVVKVMLITQSRVGNSTYAEENESYGLTTLLNDHAHIRGSKIKLAFRGKSGVDHDISFVDSSLSKIISKCQHLPGEELFAYLDDEGQAIDVTSCSVNDYLRDSMGGDFSAKDIRTWGGTVKAVETLLESEAASNLSQAKWKKRHLEVIKSTAQHLKNTVSVCRKYYIHPLVFEADKSGDLRKHFKISRAHHELTRFEALLMKILE
jgi:DNA topoisomerase-1